MKTIAARNASRLVLPMASARLQEEIQAWVAAMPIVILVTALRGMFGR